MNKIILAPLCLLIMLIFALPRSGVYSISVKRTTAISAYVFGAEIIGAVILFFIENGSGLGISFYGAVFSVPVFLIFLSLFCGESFGELVDFMAVPSFAIYILNKINCLFTDCCQGRNIGFTKEGIPIYFPSQIAEALSVCVVIGIALRLERKGKFKGTLYPLCMILYGVSRYVLNTFRRDQSVFLFGMAPGNFWSVCAVIIGLIWFAIAWIIRKRRPIYER